VMGFRSKFLAAACGNHLRSGQFRQQVTRHGRSLATDVRHGGDDSGYRYSISGSGTGRARASRPAAAAAPAWAPPARCGHAEAGPARPARRAQAPERRRASTPSIHFWTWPSPRERKRGRPLQAPRAQSPSSAPRIPETPIPIVLMGFSDFLSALAAQLRPSLRTCRPTPSRWAGKGVRVDGGPTPEMAQER